MKLPLHLLVIAALAVYAFAAVPLKAVVISYPNDTPYSVLEQAKDAIKEAGGQITHEYHLIKAFAANAPVQALEAIHATAAQHSAVIEDDQIISVNQGGS